MSEGELCKQKKRCTRFGQKKWNEGKGGVQARREKGREGETEEGGERERGRGATQRGRENDKAKGKEREGGQRGRRREREGRGAGGGERHMDVAKWVPCFQTFIQ